MGNTFRHRPKGGKARAKNMSAAKRRDSTAYDFMQDVSLYFMFYNFGRVHQTLRVTPAMEAGIADHVWSVAQPGRMDR